MWILTDIFQAVLALIAVKLAMSYPEATRIHLILDNLNIHCQKSLTDAFGSQMGSEVWERFVIHQIPKHRSWLNQAEIEIGIFSRQCLGNRRIPDLRTIRQESKAWCRRINKAATKINWRFDRTTARRAFGY